MPTDQTSKTLPAEQSAGELIAHAKYRAEIVLSDAFDPDDTRRLAEAVLWICGALEIILVEKGTK